MILTKGRLKLLLRGGKTISGIDHIRYSIGAGVIVYTIGDKEMVIDAEQVACVISK